MRKTLLRSLLIVVLVPLLYLGSVIGYAMLTDYRPTQPEALPIGGDAPMPQAYDTLTFVTWNIGYAGLGAGADFFYDGGKTVRMPQDSVQAYLQGIQETMDQLDFAYQIDHWMLQEVDRASRRSYRIDQTVAIAEQLPDWSWSFAPNYDVKFIPIPLMRPMGKAYAGQLSLSRFRPTEATRYPYTGSYDWPTYLFFLDRCFLLQRYALADGRQLLVINTHNSAYDDGTQRAQQMEQLAGVLREAQAAGHLVVAGGDWNQSPSGFRGVGDLPVRTSSLEARFQVAADFPAAGWQWAYDPLVPTNRDLDKAFDPAKTPRTILDFFLVSPGIEVLEVRGIDLGFRHSDHQPVLLRVRLPQLLPS
ncbi:MAG: endonuclease [Bacteroidia bacterium]